MGDQALLQGTIAGAGRSPKLPPNQADQCIKHPCLFAAPANDASWLSHIVDERH